VILSAPNAPRTLVIVNTVRSCAERHGGARYDTEGV